MNTFKLKTLGCKVNQYDSQQIREELLKKGFSEQENGKKADLYVVNACTVTERSDSKSLSLIREAIKENRNARVLVSGCFAKANKEAVKKQFSANVVVKNFIIGKEFSRSGIKDFKNHSRAFIKIQDGCNNLCAYCKVPLVRGESKSRDLKSIKEEAMRLISRGFKELVLCGICLGAYGRDFKQKLSLSDVISSLSDLPGDFRIRLSSIEAKDVSKRIVEIMRLSKKLCPHLHIPFQSGDNSVLKRMNRRYTSRDYFNTIAQVRKKIPLAAITTDIMVGFPGESDDNFLNTVDFLKKIRPSRIHCFPFSPRPGTAAYGFTDRVLDKAINKRMKFLLGLAGQMAYDYQNSFIGKKLEVLIEAKPDRKTGFFRGYSENYIYTLVESKTLIPGRIIKVKARSLSPHYLLARVCG